MNQTYPNCEIIVVNDGSTDQGKTECIALSYGEKIRYFSKENGKVSTALNMGIREMEGQYFAWLSHDDIFYPDKIEKQVKVMQKTGASVVAASCNFFWDNGRKIPFRMTTFYDKSRLETGVFPVIHGMMQFGGILLQRDIFEKYGLFREDLFTVQDYEFLFRILRREKCIFMDDIVNGVRCHPAQVGNTSQYMEKEKDEMYEMFLNELTPEEQVQIYGSSYNFYYQILLRLISLPYTPKSYSCCVKKVKGFINEGQGVSDQNCVYIYGAGTYGRRLLFDLRCRGIQVKGFIDKNVALKDQMIDGVNCHTLDEVDGLNKDGTIIVASEYQEEMANVLCKLGIHKYVLKKAYEQTHQMIQIPPLVENVTYWIEQYRENNWKK